MALLMTACGAKETTRNTENISDALISYLPSDAEKQEDEVIEQLLDLPSEKIESVDAYFSQTEPEKMLVVVNAKDSGTAMDVQEKMNAYVSTLENTAALYNPDQLALIQNAYVISKGNTAILVICDDVENAKKAASSMK